MPSAPAPTVKPIKHALRAILIAGEDSKDAVLTNKKLITIREGHRDYVAGQPVLLGCHLLNWATMRTIESVRHVMLVEVTPEEMQADGYSNFAEMLNSLREYYPNLDTYSSVTVIRWKPA